MGGYLRTAGGPAGGRLGTDSKEPCLQQQGAMKECHQEEQQEHRER